MEFSAMYEAGANLENEEICEGVSGTAGNE